MQWYLHQPHMHTYTYKSDCTPAKCQRPCKAHVATDSHGHTYTYTESLSLTQRVHKITDFTHVHSCTPLKSHTQFTRVLWGMTFTQTHNDVVASDFRCTHGVALTGCWQFFKRNVLLIRVPQKPFLYYVCTTCNLDSYIWTFSLNRAGPKRILGVIPLWQLRTKFCTENVFMAMNIVATKNGAVWTLIHGTSTWGMQFSNDNQVPTVHPEHSCSPTKLSWVSHTEMTVGNTGLRVFTNVWDGEWFMYPRCRSHN